MDKRLVNAVGWTVLVAWGINLVLNAALPNYNPPPELSGLMMGLFGAAFGTTSIAAWRKGKDDESKKPGAD